MLGKATEVPHASLRGIRTSDPTDSRRPVANADVVDVLTERAGARGLKITSERFAVQPRYLYPTPSTAVELPGARLFGSLGLAPILQRGWRWSVRWRASGNTLKDPTPWPLRTTRGRGSMIPVSMLQSRKNKLYNTLRCEYV